MGRSDALRGALSRHAAKLGAAVVPLAWVLGIGVPLGFWVHDLMAQDGTVELATPWALLVGLGAPLVLVVDGLLDWRRSGRMSHSHGALLAGLRPGLWVRLRHLPTALRVLAIALLALALARPQDTSRREDSEVEGIDIVVVLDMSRSMAAEDMSGPRIEAARQTILDFVRRRATDRVGIVVFGREAYTLCPLTLDYNVLQSMVSQVQLGQVDGAGTAIGNAVGTAINRLRPSTARSKVIILVTDGDSNTGNVSPDQAARFAETLGIRVYTILIGTSDEATASIGRDLFGLPISGPANQYPINPELLQRMASRTGGEYARATSREELVRQVERIDALERSKLRDQTVRYAERFTVPLLLALLLLGVDLGLRSTRLRRFP
jgi:Ca-activated chloride channel family protein